MFFVQGVQPLPLEVAGRSLRRVAPGAPPRRRRVAAAQGAPAAALSLPLLAQECDGAPL
jgi:hypothetical protein